MPRLLLLLLVAHLCQGQPSSSLDDSRYVVTRDRLASPTRASLRSRYAALTPAQLLERATAARTSSEPAHPEVYQDSAENEDLSVPLRRSPAIKPEITVERDEDESDVVTTTANSVTNRSYRKQYSTGRRRQQNDSSGNLKELLKQSGTLSLSEVLQQRNLSLSDLLQGKKLALSVLKNTEVSSTTTTTTPKPRTTIQHRIYQVTERIYTTTKRPTRDSSLFNPGQRSQFLQNKRVTSTPSPASLYEESQRWPTLSAPGDHDTRKKGDSREDILELLQPGSPVSLAQLLSSRNMTLAELMDHRERGSKQQPLADLFGEIFLNATKSAHLPTVELDVDSQPSRSQNNKHSVTLSTVKPKGSRDPRLLDLPRRTYQYPTQYPTEDEYGEAEAEQTVNNKVTVDHYDYVEDQEEEEGSVMPSAVKSAILASGGLLAITLVLFAAIFLCCKIQQRKRRGSRAPFLRASRTTRSERNVVIKPAEHKSHHDLVDF